jgi:hypothetical protein
MKSKNICVISQFHPRGQIALARDLVEGKPVAEYLEEMNGTPEVVHWLKKNFGLKKLTAAHVSRWRRGREGRRWMMGAKAVFKMKANPRQIFAELDEWPAEMVAAARRRGRAVLMGCSSYDTPQH